MFSDEVILWYTKHCLAVHRLRSIVLDCGILLKLLLETRLKSNSFDTSNDLLRFRVQKLLSKVRK